MAGNTFGELFKVHTFGESHGKAIGCIIDGCPSGLEISEELIQKELDRRKPAQSKISTQRKEGDLVEILSGIFEGKTTGTPITLLIKNKDARSRDYDRFKDTWRPSHADFTWEEKFGIYDFRGGGRSSARETASRVAAGAIAKGLLKHYKVNISAFVSAVGHEKLQENEEIDLAEVENNIVRAPNKEAAGRFTNAIEQARKEKDSLGGIIRCYIQNPPSGLGEPVFKKLEAELAKAMLSINASKGFEIGRGFEAARMKGSEHNDVFENVKGKVRPAANNAGGTLGGISSGNNIYFNTAFKPVATIAKTQKTANKQGKIVELQGKGRHDPCVLPRAVPIVEAMAALVLADLILFARLNRI